MENRYVLRIVTKASKYRALSLLLYSLYLDGRNYLLSVAKDLILLNELLARILPLRSATFAFRRLHRASQPQV